MRRFVIRVFEVLAYFGGLDVLFYFLNRNAKRIVTFHNILPDSLFIPGIANGVGNSEGEFRLIVREVGKRFTFSTDVTDARTATLTFDDGYLNQYETASRALDELGRIPAIIFISENLIGTTLPSSALVVDQLLHWVAFVPAGRYVFKPFSEEYILILSDPSSRRQAWINIVRPAFAKDTDKKGGHVLSVLNSVYPLEQIYAALSSDYTRLRLLGLSTTQLDDLRERGWLVGWHTKTHFPLKQQMVDSQEDELNAPAIYRNVVLGYPYGESSSVGSETIELAREMGYPCAVSNTTDPGLPFGRWFLPRMALSADKYALHFELSGLKYFLQHHRLLPCVEKWD